MSTFAKRKRLLMTKQLPTWGEPILPHVWKTSEEEINLKFPFPAIPVEMTRNHRDGGEEDDDNNNGFIEDRTPVVSFPYQEEKLPMDGPFFLQPKTVSGIEQFLVQESRHEEEDGLQEDFTDHDSCSEYYSSEEAVSPTSHSSGSSSYIFNTIDIDMDSNPCISFDDSPLAAVPADTFGQELVGDIIMSTQTEPSPSPIAWIIETYYDVNQELCFKLQMTESGASMILMKDEILESVKIIVEKEEEEEEDEEDYDGKTLFDIKSINGDSEFVELSNVLQKISDIISSLDGITHKKKTTKRERDLDNNISDVVIPRSHHNHPSSSSSSLVLSSRRRRRRENQDTTTTDESNKKRKNEKRKSPFRSAWKVLATRRSTTRPPPTMVE